MIRRCAFGLCLLALSLLPLENASAQAVGSGWKSLGQEKGVTISMLPAKGDGQATYRGQAVIEGAVLHVLAIILDTPKSTKWVRGADAIQVLRNVDGRTQLVHMFTDLPWPIRDRDMVMRRSVEVLKEGSEFRVRFQCANGVRKEERGSLRVTTCNSFFTIKGVGAQKTSVDYQVHLDPGGGLPDWGIRFLEKRVTVDTISKLERQVKRTLGQYKDVVERWRTER